MDGQYRQDPFPFRDQAALAQAIRCSRFHIVGRGGYEAHRRVIGRDDLVQRRFGNGGEAVANEGGQSNEAVRKDDLGCDWG